MGLYQKIRDIDRRLIFLVMGIAVVIPLLLTIQFPEYPTPMVRSTFDIVETLPEGSRVLMSFDYDPASEPELQPMATAWLRHCVERRHKVIIMALWPIGQDMARDTIAQVQADLTRRHAETGEKTPFIYGVDYVNIGYKSGGQGVINVVLTDFEKLYPVDTTNRALATIPIMKNIRSLKDVDLLVNISAGQPGLKEWVQFGADPAGVRIVGGSTAVQSPLLYPYYPKQLHGMLGGLKAAAEYEQLLGERYPQYADISLNKGRIRMGAQAIAHLVIMAFIVIGNVTFFIDRKRGARR